MAKKLPSTRHRAPGYWRTVAEGKADERRHVTRPETERVKDERFCAALERLYDDPEYWEALERNGSRRVKALARRRLEELRAAQKESPANRRKCRI